MSRQEEKEERGPPVLEVVVKASVAVGMPLHHFRIWPDGHVEGFEKLGADVVVVNRIPMLLGSLTEPLRGFLENVEGEIRRLAAGQQLMEPAAESGIVRLDS